MKDNKAKFYDRFDKELGKEYTLLSEYVDYNHTKIKVRHNVCGNEYEVLPATIFKGHGCAECFGNKKYTTKSFKEKVKSIVGDEYTILGEYTGNKNKLLMRHNECGIEYEVKPNVFLTGSRCPNCAKNKPYTTETFKLKVKEIAGDEYEVLGEYKNSQTDILMKHNKCGSEYIVKPTVFIGGHGCPNCYKSVPYTTDEYKKKVYDLVGDRYTVLGEYKRAKDKIEIRHNICGNVYKVNPLMFFVGNRCPKCSLISSRSLPEEIVAYFISDYFKIEQSYRPDWLKLSTGNNGELDIWIPELKIGIEYDGRIHGVDNGIQKDIEKNSIIENSSEIIRLYRIRENNLEYMAETKKIKILVAKKMISLSSNRGKEELENIISNILSDICNKDIKVKIDDEIINSCRNKVEDYYKKEGKKRIKRKANNKFNTKIFKEKVFEKTNNEYKVLGKYKDSHTNILMKHLKCGNEYEVKPYQFLNGSRCPKCAKNYHFSSDEYAEKFKNQFNEEFTLLEEYVDAKTLIKIKHNTCNHEFYIKPTYFFKHPNCPRCSNRVKYTHELFVEKVYKLFGDEYEVMGQYVNSQTKILMKHNTCGSTYNVVPTSVLSGKRCPCCFKSVPYTTEQISQRIKDEKKGEYELIGEYVGKNTPIKVKHNICGNEFDVLTYHFLNSQMKCKVCKK